MKIGDHEYDDDGYINGSPRLQVDRAGTVRVKGVKGMEESHLNTVIPLMAMEAVKDAGIAVTEDEGRAVAAYYGMPVEVILSASE